MARIGRIAALWSSVALVVVLAACSGPQSVGHEASGDESVSQLLSSSLRLSGGSVRVEGYLRGVSSDDVNMQGITKGGYAVQCTKPQGNTEPEGQFKVSDGAASERVPLKRGAVKLGDKKNEADFRMFPPDEGPGDPNDACPQGPNEDHWIGTFVVDENEEPIWLVTKVYVRWTQDGVDWFPYSWTCSEPTPTAHVDQCGENVPADELSDDVWGSFVGS